MNKTYLIFRHEFLNTVRRTGFIIMTLIVPLLALLGIGAYHVVSGISKPVEEAEKIGYVDEAGGFDQFTSHGNLTLVPFQTQDEANNALAINEIKEYFIIPPDYISTGVVNRYTMQKELYPPPATMTAINTFLLKNLLSGQVPASTASRIEAPLNLVTVTLTATGEVAPEQGGFGNFVFPGVFSILLVLAIIFSSTYLLQGLGEEKENRLIEILLSSVSTRQLLTSKVLGIGAAGLVQVAVWVVSAPLLLRLASSSIGGFISTIQLPAHFLILGIIYFILGYLLFAVLSASIGAISSSSREGQQLIAIFTLPAVAPLWFISLLMMFPNNPVWIGLSIFPLTAPVAVMIRLGVTDVPAWQLAASIAVLVVSIVGGLLITIRVFRTYLLMYGKRPGLGKVLSMVLKG
ncbi:MAG: ABC transporter permease [Dehalococcoidales bacterium]|nr:ABC transporter permease [Dehalococcoidales bacterium]